MFNIGMLKKVFAPSFQLHDIRQTGEYEVGTSFLRSMPSRPHCSLSVGLHVALLVVCWEWRGVVYLDRSQLGTTKACCQDLATELSGGKS